MSDALVERMRGALTGSALADRFPAAGEAFLERRSLDDAAAQIDGPSLLGLARVVATQPAAAGFLSHRPRVLERLAGADAGALDARARALVAAEATWDPGDLEDALDALRLLRREESCFAACLDLGDAVSFEATSEFLSILAESIARRALRLAATPDSPPLAVIGLGKIAGHEFTYHSDLDLILLYDGKPEALEIASRVGQRLISYLTTMTGAGIAYAVDTRLRPSGRQGTLVTSYDAFERYQSERAEIWEHVAVLRARAIAGDIRAAQRMIDRVHTRTIESGADPWPYLASLRERVVAERGRESETQISIKTGLGGTMDVDFLASGGLIECGRAPAPALPSIPAMLRAAVDGARADALLADYRFLRVVEARARWVAGRAVESLRGADDLAAVAELVETGLNVGDLRDLVVAARRRIRGEYLAVTEAGSIRALSQRA